MEIKKHRGSRDKETKVEYKLTHTVVIRRVTGRGDNHTEYSKKKKKNF